MSPTDPAARKAELRRDLLARRRARPEPDLRAARAAIAGHAVRRVREEGWRVVAAYVPLRTEPGSVDLLAGLRAAGAEVLVPVLLPDRDLDWVAWESQDPLGVGVVGTCDALFVPALAATTDGRRLGRGGGSYDRVLGRRRVGAPAIALLFDGEVVADLPTEAWDAPVDEAVTPAGFLRLGPA